MSVSSSAERPSKRPVTVLGAGAVGTALARRMAGAGITVAGVISRDVSAADRLAAAVDASVAASNEEALPASTRAVFLCVPDDVIGDVAYRLAQIDHPWHKTVVAHTSGAVPAAVLGVLSGEGAALLSLHPMQTFPGPDHPGAFDDIFVGLEGDPIAVEYGAALVRRLGARPLRLSANEKTRVHAAAALASNGLAALLAVVREVLGTAGIAPDDATAVVQPLIDRTWSNLSQESPESAMTGPVARGDSGTIRKHLDALQSAAPHLLPVYCALAKEQVRVARRADKLTHDQAGAILDLLRSSDPNI
ncbi:Rossmann-like and DUF2520 domain-containing protein [Longibacter sp.]|uniref:Rossmann-like and DUF2520 domain-containing protein n=1 Tax=Longibacter sp. TaxID=2045415 RepID=UPI003EB6E216